MIAYFIGGTRDLTKQAFPGIRPVRQQQYLAPYHYDEAAIQREHYMLLGQVPTAREETYIYVYTHSETVNLESREG